MKYLLSLLTVLIPLLTFAQHNCNEDVIQLNESIQFSIVDKQQSTSTQLEKMPTRKSYCMCNYSYDVSNTDHRGINLPGTYIEYRWNKKIGTPASEGSLEVKHLEMAANNTRVFSRPTPYGYYPMD